MKKEIYLTTVLLLTLFSFINLWSAEEPETKKLKREIDKMTRLSTVEFYPSDSEPFSIYQERNQLFIDTREKKYLMIYEWDATKRGEWEADNYNVKIYNCEGKIILEKNTLNSVKDFSYLPIRINDNGVIIELKDPTVIEPAQTENRNMPPVVLYTVRLYLNEGKDIIDTDIVTQEAKIFANPFADNFVLSCYKARNKTGNLSPIPGRGLFTAITWNLISIFIAMMGPF
ncbi:MAG: hypothetical protein PHR06_08425 [Candidatus Cloacimonetes bacterium]|nr:hypothetical protein [Candidatus Cloacimonadota bacterium]